MGLIQVKGNIAQRRGSLPLSLPVARNGYLTPQEQWQKLKEVSQVAIKPKGLVSRPSQIIMHKDQGLGRANFELMRQLSRVMMQAIFLRPINPANMELVPLLYPSKPLAIKLKTSDSNFANGFLPANPIYSKLNAIPDKIPDAIKAIETLFREKPQLTVPEQLTLQTDRLLKLLVDAECQRYPDGASHSSISRWTDTAPSSRVH